MLHVSFGKYVGDILVRGGFAEKPYRRGILGTRVYRKNGRAVVVVRTVEIEPPFVRPVDQSIDDYFKRLRDFLDGLGKRNRVTDVFLPGGGTIPVPEWFKAWCAEKGIRLHILDVDNPVPREFNAEA